MKGSLRKKYKFFKKNKHKCLVSRSKINWLDSLSGKCKRKIELWPREIERLRDCWKKIMIKNKEW